MINSTEDFAGKTKYNFYTYIGDGRDVIIPIYADDEKHAWEHYIRLYGKDTFVEMVKEEK